MKSYKMYPLIKVSLLFILVLFTCRVFSDTGSGRIEELLSQGKLDQALDLTERQLTQDKGNVNLLFLKGLILTRKDRLDEARKLFEDLTEDNPELPEPFNNLAVIYAAQGDYANARLALQKAINTHPSYATAHENLGDIYAKMASKAYNEALELDNSNETAREKLLLVSDLFSIEVREQEKIIQARTREAEKISAELEQLENSLADAEEQTRAEMAKADQVREEIDKLRLERDRAIQDLQEKQAQAEREANAAEIKAQQTKRDLVRIERQSSQAIEKARLEQRKAEEESSKLQETLSGIQGEISQLTERRDRIVKQAQDEQKTAEEQASKARANVLKVRQELADLEKRRDELATSVERRSAMAEEQISIAQDRIEQVQAEITQLEQQRDDILEQSEKERQQALAQVKNTKLELENISGELARLQNQRTKLEQQNQIQLAKLDGTRAQSGQETTQTEPNEPDQLEIISVVNDWARKWSNRDVEGYLAAYSSDFKPPDGISVNVWRSQRKDRLLSPSYIRVNVDDFRVKFISDQYAQVVFVQEYQSDTYSDTVEKTLLMHNKDGRWLIAEEESD